MINSIMSANLRSIQQTLSTVIMSKAMNQDSTALTLVKEMMPPTSGSLGANLDLLV